VFVKSPPPVPDLLFSDERCLLQNCGQTVRHWYMHTSSGMTAVDGSGYCKLIRLCDGHALGEPLPKGMVKMDEAEVRALWEAHGGFDGRLGLARRQNFCVVERGYAASKPLRARWAEECAGARRTAVFVVEEAVEMWRVEWTPAVQTEDLRTPAGDSAAAIRAHVDARYRELSKDRPWAGGSMRMDESGFRTPPAPFEGACGFAVRVVRLEDSLRDPESLMVDMVHDF